MKTKFNWGGLIYWPGDHESCQGHLASRYAGLGAIALIFLSQRFMFLLLLSDLNYIAKI